MQDSYGFAHYYSNASESNVWSLPLGHEALKEESP